MVNTNESMRFDGPAQTVGPALRMAKFPLAPVHVKQRRTGHPVRQTGMNGKRLRVTSKPAQVKP